MMSCLWSLLLILIFFVVILIHLFSSGIPSSFSRNNRRVYDRRSGLSLEGRRSGSGDKNSSSASFYSAKVQDRILYFQNQYRYLSSHITSLFLLLLFYSIKKAKKTFFLLLIFWPSSSFKRNSSFLSLYFCWANPWYQRPLLNFPTFGIRNHREEATEWKEYERGPDCNFGCIISLSVSLGYSIASTPLFSEKFLDANTKKSINICVKSLSLCCILVK